MYITFRKALVTILSAITLSVPLFAQGEVLLVLGSDTGIWNGLTPSNYHCYYDLSLYTDPAQNGYKVMDPAFRNNLKDSYGRTMRFTWWMMGGNMFRYATNKNIPIPNILPLYLMKKYHGESIEQFGDELSLHYHTFHWYDYDGNGKYYWNQAQQFIDSKEDFDFTMAQFLLEENVYPVSFRSGWHAMDNYWQNYLDRLLPYSMHNDYPGKHNDTEEPLDNIYDWSQASSEYVPFHPSSTNYQLKGNLKGWNVRSSHIGNMTLSKMTQLFVQAQQGKTQVACLWGHLPEDDFLDNMRKIDSLAHKAALSYPNIKFRYCTAIEAMQLWRKGTDWEKPVLTVTEVTSGNQTEFTIQTNEPIFQAEPFVAVKDIYENYYIVPCTQSGVNQWRTTRTFERAKIAKVGAAVTDTMGNLSTKIINFLPDDIFVDDNDAGYSESSGTWTNNTAVSWDLDSRMATLSKSDSAIASWKASISQPGTYNIFIQLPKVSNPALQTEVKITNNSTLLSDKKFTQPLKQSDWTYLGTHQLAAGECIVELKAYGSAQEGKILGADAVKISALVKDKQFSVYPGFVDFGAVPEQDTAIYRVKLINSGTISSINVLSAKTSTKLFTGTLKLPVSIAPMDSISLPVSFSSFEKETFEDTLVITSDDPVNPTILVPLKADVEMYFRIVDNEDTVNYKEKGKWSKSVAQAFGTSSRIAYLKQQPPAEAAFSGTVKKSGIYKVQEIVPLTVNASNNALYALYIDQVQTDTITIDQNAESSFWKTLWQKYVAAGSRIEVRVIDTRKSTVGAVLRTDAVKFALVEEGTGVEKEDSRVIPSDFTLEQNYPNPFNPSTRISYALPKGCMVNISVYDLLGREVKNLVNEFMNAGRYTVEFSGHDLASGIYYYVLRAGGYKSGRKMVLIK